MKRITLCLILIVLLIGCKNTEKYEKSSIITFNLKDNSKISTLRLSELGFSEIKYIPLESNENCMIPSIEAMVLNWGSYRIIFVDDIILIKNWNTILKFKDSGAFINRIGVEGRGPEEFLVAHDIDVNPLNKYVYLVSAWQKKINVYSENSNFLRSYSIPFYAPVSFRFIDGKILCYFDNIQGSVENSFVLMDTSGGIIKYYPNKYPYSIKNNSMFGLPHENLFYQYNNHLFKKEVYSDTIYVFEKNYFMPHMVLASGDKLISPSIRSEYDGFYIGEHYIQPLNLFEFGDYIFYGFINCTILNKVSEHFGFIGSKKNDFEVLFDLEKGIINDLDGGPDIIPVSVKDDNTLISLVDAMSFKAHVSSDKFKNVRPKYPDKKRELEKLASEIKDTDNPIIVLLRLK
jgi:hypothetical protein